MIECFDKLPTCIEFLQTLVKDSKDDFSHEDYCAVRDISADNSNVWYLDETFGRKKVVSSTSKGVLYTREQWNKENK